MKGQYGEPWESQPDDRVGQNYNIVSVRNVTVCFMATGWNSDDYVYHQAERIVACVNAFDGIDDPKAFMEKLEAEVARLREELNAALEAGDSSAPDPIGAELVHDMVASEYEWKAIADALVKAGKRLRDYRNHAGAVDAWVSVVARYEAMKRGTQHAEATKGQTDETRTTNPGRPAGDDRQL